MAKIWYGHFDSMIEDRRSLLAEDWAKYIRSFITDGIRNGGSCLQINASSQMKIKMDTGIANVQGYIFIAEQDSKGRYTELEVEEAHNLYDRVDRVVLRLDRNANKRTLEPIILRGVASANPLPPSLTRNRIVYEISLAKILVKANTIVIRQENITDERFNQEVCGLINSILGLDSGAWQRQFDEATEKMKREKTTLFNDFSREFDTSQSNRNTAFEQQKNTFNDWYNEVKIDITKLQSFNFDNLGELKGTTRTTQFSANRINEVIKTTSRNTKVAERLTEILSRTSTKVTTKVYERNGVDIMKQTVVNTNVDVTNNTVSEVIL